MVRPSSDSRSRRALRHCAECKRANRQGAEFRENVKMPIRQISDHFTKCRLHWAVLFVVIEPNWNKLLAKRTFRKMPPKSGHKCLRQCFTPSLIVYGPEACSRNSNGPRKRVSIKTCTIKFDQWAWSISLCPVRFDQVSLCLVGLDQFDNFFRKKVGLEIDTLSEHNRFGT
jgi:hypothetical protein